MMNSSPEFSTRKRRRSSTVGERDSDQDVDDGPPRKLDAREVEDVDRTRVGELDTVDPQESSCKWYKNLAISP